MQVEEIHSSKEYCSMVFESITDLSYSVLLVREFLTNRRHNHQLLNSRIINGQIERMEDLMDRCVEIGVRVRITVRHKLCDRQLTIPANPASKASKVQSQLPPQSSSTNKEDEDDVDEVS